MIKNELIKKLIPESRINLSNPLWQTNTTMISLGSGVWIGILWTHSFLKELGTTNSRIENHLLNIIGDLNFKVNRLFLQYIFWDDI
jgi:hypothetical protein